MRGFQVLVSGVALAVTLAYASTAVAQQPPPTPPAGQQPPAPTANQTPAAPAEPAKPVLKLNGDVAMITMLIKPDKTADFEFVLNKLKEALNKSDKAERKKQAAGWHVYKSSQMAQGSAVYIMIIEPV